MSWYRSGTVDVTNGSPTVVGHSTSWLNQVRSGDVFSLTGSKIYEVDSVTDDVTLTLSSPITESSAAGAAYSIIRNFTDNTSAQAVSRLTSLLDQIQTYEGGDFKRDGTVAMTGNLRLDRNEVQNPKFKSYSEKLGTHTLNGTVLTLDATTGNFFSITLPTNISSINFTSVPQDVYIFNIELIQDATGGRTVVGWPANSKWHQGVQFAATVTANAKDLVSGYVVSGTQFNFAFSMKDIK